MTYIVTDYATYKEYPIIANRCDIVDGSIILSNSCTDLIASFSAKDFFVQKSIESRKSNAFPSDTEEKVCKDINQWQEYAKTFKLCLKDCEKLTAYEQGKKTVYVKDMNNLASRQNQYIVHEEYPQFQKKDITISKKQIESIEKIIKDIKQVLNLLK